MSIGMLLISVELLIMLSTHSQQYDESSRLQKDDAFASAVTSRWKP